jgi:beta-mannosidase
LNNQVLHVQEGMFTYVELDLTDYLEKDNRLEIKIMPVSKKHDFPEDRSQASNVTKPAVSYGWDWHPRLIPLGIWDETYMEERAASHITDVQIEYTLTDNFSQAVITLNAEAVLHSDCDYEWTLFDRQGKIVARLNGKMQEALKNNCTLKQPELWWTHDHGIPYLYQSLFELVDEWGNVLSSDKQKTGFRRIQLVMNEGAWEEPKEFPKTRSVQPAQFELNGRRIFAKGSNWVNPEIFPGTLTKERYKELIDIAVDANFNILRTWGGAIVNKESFFELCDESGILVWQEFPLACNFYPDEPHYLSILKQEATSIIKRLRKHACIALWCGGNELFNSWSKMTDQSLALRMLNSLCLEYDLHTPFIPTSPLFGMGHGNYVFQWEGRDIFETMNTSRNTAYSEFGMPGIAPREVLEKIIPPAELFPPKAGTAWQTHHAFGSWDADKSTWLCQPLLAEYFGEALSLDELICQSQTLQSEGYKAIYEEARRQKPYCSMALNWCFNEPWSAAANNSLLAYPAIPKPALSAVRNACRPVCASARFSRFRWEEGDCFIADIWLLNDSFEEIKSQTMIVKIQTGNEQIILLEWQSPVAPVNANIEGPTVRFRLPKWNTDHFNVFVEVAGIPAYNSEYLLIYRSKKETAVSTATMNI